MPDGHKIGIFFGIYSHSIVFDSISDGGSCESLGILIYYYFHKKKYSVHFLPCVPHQALLSI